MRTLAAWSVSVDDAEEYAAVAVARAVDQSHEGRLPDDLAAWCVSVAERARIDDHRRRGVLQRLAPEIAREDTVAPDHPIDPDELPTGGSALDVGWPCSSWPATRRWCPGRSWCWHCGWCAVCLDLAAG